MYGLTVLAGAIHDAEAGGQAGAAHVFRNDGRAWNEGAKLIASDAAPGGNFGGSVSVSQDLAIVAGGEKAYIFTGMQGIDCNDNNDPDACDIFNGDSLDDNGNGIPDECDSILGDIDGDGTVGAADLLILLVNWGRCGDGDDCPADLDGNCTVGASDLLILLANWG